MEENLNSTNYIRFNYILEVLEKESRNSIRAWGFMGSQLEHNVLYLFVRNMDIQTADLLVR